MNKTPFEAGKTAKELGIDTSKKFLVVREAFGIPFKVGDIIILDIDDNSSCPRFVFVDNQLDFWYFKWSDLAYAEEQEAYKPMVGDRVQMEGCIRSVSVTPGLWFSVVFNGAPDEDRCVFEDDEIKHVKLLSRKTRTLTKAEAEAMLTEKLGESVVIE